MKINLTFNREDFEEIYFQNNQKSLFFGPITKSKFSTFLLCFFIFASIGVASFYWSIHPTYNVMSFVFVLITLTGYLIALNTLIKRNQSIKLHLNQLEKFKTNILEVESKSLIVKQDDETTIVSWDSIKTSKIVNDYIELNGSEHIVIPKKSMTELEFNSLKTLIESKLK